MPIATSNHASSSRHTNGRGKGRALRETSENDSDGERVRKPGVNGVREESGWTIDTFEDRPIDKSTEIIVQLRGVVDKLKEMVRLIEGSMRKAKDVANALEDSNEDDPTILDIEKGFLRSIEQRQLMLFKIEVLDQMIMSVRQNEVLRQPEARYREETERMSQEYLAKTSRQKFKNDKDYKAFRFDLWELNHSTACPAVTRWLPREDDDISDDEDFEMGGVTQNYRCPITLQKLEDAVTSKQCEHSYSRKAIMGIIDDARKMAGSRRKAARCPLPGCTAEVTLEVLQPNPELQRKADFYDKKAKQRLGEEMDGVDLTQDD